MPIVAAIGAAALLAACSSGGASSSSAAKDADFSYLGQTENTTIVGTLKGLSAAECKTQNTAMPFKASTAPGASFDQKMQLLAGQDALSNMSMSAGTPTLMKQFIKAGKLQDLSKVLEDSGAADTILPAAKSTIQALYGDKGLYALPTEYNIEGFWYNKKIFSDNGIEVPKTWTELVAASAKLKAAGVQPISSDGKEGWPLTRLVGNYIFRDLGRDALQQVADGKAKLTDPQYVKAADAVAELGKAGAFGKAVGSIDYNTMINLFLTGKAAMMYNGSWTLANFHDAKQNKIGEANIGYMAFPAVEGGKGSIDDVPSNVGVPVSFATKGYDTRVGAWVNCIAKNYGDRVLKNDGVVSGFKLSQAPSNLPPLTAEVQKTVASTTNSVLWFEAQFSPKGTTVSQTNAAQLVNGQITGEQFMKLVQSANAS